MSGIFFPVEQMPPWIQKAVWFTPLYHAVGATRAVVHNGSLTAAAGHFAWLLTVTAIAFLAALLLIRRRLVN